MHMSLLPLVLAVVLRVRGMWATMSKMLFAAENAGTGGAIMTSRAYVLTADGATVGLVMASALAAMLVISAAAAQEARDGLQQTSKKAGRAVASAPRVVAMPLPAGGPGCEEMNALSQFAAEAAARSAIRHRVYAVRPSSFWSTRRGASGRASNRRSLLALAAFRPKDAGTGLRMGTRTGGALGVCAKEARQRRAMINLPRHAVLPATLFRDENQVETTFGTHLPDVYLGMLPAAAGAAAKEDAIPMCSCGCGHHSPPLAAGKCDGPSRYELVAASVTAPRIGMPACYSPCSSARASTLPSEASLTLPVPDQPRRQSKPRPHPQSQVTHKTAGKGTAKEGMRVITNIVHAAAPNLSPVSVVRTCSSSPASTITAPVSAPTLASVAVTGVAAATFPRCVAATNDYVALDMAESCVPSSMAELIVPAALPAFGSVDKGVAGNVITPAARLSKPEGLLGCAAIGTFAPVQPPHMAYRCHTLGDSPVLSFVLAVLAFVSALFQSTMHKTHTKKTPSMFV